MRLGVLNGVTVMGAGDTPAAVVAITGRVKNINVMQSALAGKQAYKRASAQGLKYSNSIMSGSVHFDSNPKPYFRS